jgi:hypothetical protein
MKNKFYVAAFLFFLCASASLRLCVLNIVPLINPELSLNIFKRRDAKTQRRREKEKGFKNKKIFDSLIRMGAGTNLRIQKII